MKNSESSYTFREVNSSDFSLLSTWLEEPMVSRWYGDPDYIDDLAENLEDSRIRMQLVIHNNDPVAYIQDYDIHSWSDHHLDFLPAGSKGIDTFIGSSKWIGKGHGTNYLSLFTEQMFHAGVPALGIDPHPENVIARRVYGKIGFHENGIIESEWGTVVTMYLDNPHART